MKAAKVIAQYDSKTKEYIIEHFDAQGKKLEWDTEFYDSKAIMLENLKLIRKNYPNVQWENKTI